MLQELSHMDRITQLQDEIQQVRGFAWFACVGVVADDHDGGVGFDSSLR